MTQEIDDAALEAAVKAIAANDVWAQIHGQEKRDYYECARAAVYAYLKALPASRAQDDGWVLVPKKPTEAMLDAGRIYASEYRAMLAAAPLRQQEGE